MLGTHHLFQQAVYQGSWRLFDMSSRKAWLCRDNATVAGRRTFEQDVYLMVRQDPAGRIRPWIPGFPLKAGLGSSAQELPPMEPRLQPGEKASLCWHNEGRWFAAIKGKHEPMHPPYIPPLFGNGAVIYEPDTQGGAAAMENLLAERTQDGATLLRAEDPDKPASLTYRAETAFMYTHVDISGAYSAANPAALTASLSLDEGKTWTGIWKNPKAEGSIDASLAAAVTGRTAYWLKIGLAPDPKALLKGLRVRSVILEAPLALPGRLKRGENRVELFGAPAAPIRVTCKWTERYRSDLGLSINGIGFYTMEDDFRRNLFVVAPGGEFEIETGLQGETFRGELAVEGIPAGWDCDRPLKAVTLGDAKDRVEIAFRVRAAGARTGELHALSVVLRQGETIRRRLPVQVLIAENALAREAEAADALPADATAVEDTAVSGGKAVAFRGKSGIEFHLDTPKAETYALWVRARWSPKSRKALYAWMDGETPRRRLAAFKPVAPSTWASANVAHTKTFSHFGEQFVHWTWYRVPGFKLKSGSHRLYVGTEKDGFLDAIMLLPQNDKVDCSATRLLQNWNFAPWRNPW